MTVGRLTLLGSGPSVAGGGGGSGITQSTGLIVYYTFDNADTTTSQANDTNPNGFGPYHSTFTGTVLASVTGRILQGREFGSSKYGITSSTFQAPQTALSVCVWINPLIINATEAIAAQAGGGGVAWEFFQNSDGTLFNRIRNGSNWIGRSTTTAITTSSWQHIAMTWSGGTTAASTKIYKNAVQIDTTDGNNGSFTAINSASLELCICNEGGAFLLDSALDDFRLYNRELSGADISAIYTAGSSGNP